MEREWTRALCGGDSAALASLNAAMKRIDLTCLIASPILVRCLPHPALWHAPSHAPCSCNSAGLFAPQPHLPKHPSIVSLAPLLLPSRPGF